MLEEKQRGLLISSQNTNIIYSSLNTAPILTKEEVQARRDEVREMVTQEKPLERIPMYEGKDRDGKAIEFFKENYYQYIHIGYETIFANDLIKIDDRLLRAIRNECRNGTPYPIGTASDLSKALVNGRFTDGKNTNSRIAMVRWRIKNQQKVQKAI